MSKSEMKGPSDESLEIAAQCWCDPETIGRTMDVELAIAFAKRLDVVRDELETERMRLAACGVAAMCNTPESAAKQRLDGGSQYWSASYMDICNAIDREILLRARSEKLAEALSRFAKIEADDGDDFEGVHEDVILRVEVTAGDIHAARAAPAEWEGK